MKQLNSIVSIQNNLSHLSHRLSNRIMPTIPLVLDKLNFRFLYQKRNVGISRRTRGRKQQHSIGIFASKYVPKPIQFPVLSTSSTLNLKFPVLKVDPKGSFLLDQIRPHSNSTHFVTNEEEFDSILHEREFEMHRHIRSPISTIFKYAKDSLLGTHTTNEQTRILDLASFPFDPTINIAKELPQASFYALSPSRDVLKVVSDKILVENVPNLMTEYHDMEDLSQFESNSFDLVISCYGLQNSKDPSKLVNEIHRVLRPGGRMIVAVWEHLGTEPIVDRILEKVSSGKKVGLERSKLTTPHLLEKIVEGSGLKIMDINRGEYPLYLSSIDGLHSSAFDVVSLPIKKELVDLMHKGERPYAFEDARAEFDDIVSKGHLVTTDAMGRLVVENNRYKIIIARRQYEDNDRKVDIERAKASSRPTAKIGLATPDVKAVEKMVNDFNKLLADTIQCIPNSPWKFLVDSVKRDIVENGHGSQVGKRVNILDLASCPSEVTKMMIESIPNINFHSSTENGLLKDFEDASMDIVTCAFGITQFSDPDHILKEIHRVLKPGGSLIVTTWDSIALERIGEVILSSVLIDKDPHIITPISNLSSYSAPRKLESLIETSGKLIISKADHYEFPFDLGEADIMSPSSSVSAFNNAIIPIRHLLTKLEETSINPNAFDDARKAYQNLLDNNQLMWRDEGGKVKTVHNRYKFIVARRTFEDADGVLDKTDFEMK